MDCRLAQETLDAGRPDRSDWHAPELRAAAEHWQKCLECQAVFRDRRDWDERLSVALEEIEIPAGLQDRLLAALEAEHGAPVPAVRPTSRTSRQLRWVLTAAAGLLMAAGIWYLRPASVVAMPIEEVLARLDDRLPPVSHVSINEPLARFDGAFPALPLDAIWREAVAEAPALGLDLDDLAGQDAAVYQFQERRVSGWLVVLPKDRVAVPPTDALPTHANLRYGPRPQVAWTSGDHVYVCVLERGTLDDLRREFYGSAA